MSFIIDNLSEIPYFGFAMQNLIELKKRAEAQIKAIQADIDAMDKVLGLGDKYSEESTLNVMANLRQTRKGTGILEPEAIEKTILKINGDFQAVDITAIINEAFPDCICSKIAINTALHQLIKSKKLRYIRERAGRRPAIYHKA